jgi:hypothetical protein
VIFRKPHPKQAELKFDELYGPPIKITVKRAVSTTQQPTEHSTIVPTIPTPPPTPIKTTNSAVTIRKIGIRKHPDLWTNEDIKSCITRRTESITKWMRQNYFTEPFIKKTNGFEQFQSIFFEIPQQLTIHKCLTEIL